MIKNRSSNSSSTYKDQEFSSPFNLNQSSKYNKQSKENMNFGIQSQNRRKKISLNPNLDIQDQYVENLLKQAHFMNMEVKLLKQKQAQSDNNVLWQIITKSKEPLIKNIVQSSEKYQNMKTNIDSQYQQLLAYNLKIADLQNAALKQFEYLESKLLTIKKKRQASEINFKQKQDKNSQRINQHTVRLKLIIDEKYKQKKRNLALEKQLESIIMEGEKDQSKRAYELNKIRNDEIIEEQMEKQEKAQIEDLNSKIAALKSKFLANQDYQKSKQEQDFLKQRINNLEKDISSANFQLLKLTQSIKLAEEEINKQIKERKKITEDYEISKSIFLQISLLNSQRKQKQTQKRKKQSLQIQKAQYQTKKLQKNLEEIKTKVSKSQQAQNQLKIEVQGLQRDLQKLKNKKQELKKELCQVSVKNEEQDRNILAYTNEIRKLESQHQKVSNEQFLLTCELQSIERETQYLKARKDYLYEALNLKDTINQAKLDDLQKVVQKNNDLNQTVIALMSKLQEIKAFSRM